jgi:phosphoketolase
MTSEAVSLHMLTNTLTPELLHKIDAYWRAANYLSVGQIYLYEARYFGPHTYERIDAKGTFHTQWEKE